LASTAAAAVMFNCCQLLDLLPTVAEKTAEMVVNISHSSTAAAGGFVDEIVYSYYISCIDKKRFISIFSMGQFLNLYKFKARVF